MNILEVFQLKKRMDRLRIVSLVIAITVLIMTVASCQRSKESSEEDTSSDTERTVSSTTLDNTTNGDTEGYSETTTSAWQNPVETTKATTTTTTKSPTTTTTTSGTIEVPIPEGWTVFQIADRLAARNVCKKADYLNAINNYNFTTHPEVTNCISGVANLCYKYEGYQFPATYKFHENENAEDVVGTMMRKAGENITNLSYTGMKTHQIVTLASIIEIEAAKTDDRKLISSVLHNRLDKGMPLQCDSTRKYLTVYVKASLGDEAVEKYKYFYNTYRSTCTALPVGPICNPSIDALEAAVKFPKTDYLYFHSESDGTYHFQTEKEYSDSLKSSSSDS